jgi:hypothetical protein
MFEKYLARLAEVRKLEAELTTVNAVHSEALSKAAAEAATAQDLETCARQLMALKLHRSAP